MVHAFNQANTEILNSTAIMPYQKGKKSGVKTTGGDYPVPVQPGLYED